MYNSLKDQPHLSPEEKILFQFPRVIQDSQDPDPGLTWQSPCFLLIHIPTGSCGVSDF
jgi:hypothetical protein